MNVTGANLNAIFLNLSKVFNQTFNDVPVEYTDIAMVVPSNGAYIDYRWLANFPQMKEWVGKKHITKLAEYDYVIRNKDYAATIEVRRNDIEDDQMGIYKPQAESAAWSAARAATPASFPWAGHGPPWSDSSWNPPCKPERENEHG